MSEQAKQRQAITAGVLTCKVVLPPGDLILPDDSPCAVIGLRPAYFVPVSFVAQDWKVTPRRIRFLLSENRLEGRRLTNGYWEVAYPYRFLFGQRGPTLKRQQQPKKSSGKPELRAV